ncbi:mitochondrial import inner membrane translocase subunit Tim10 B [Bacillus rossius redtenbacheri]|uniref:mitochondrial import inner membrane translocase subunit Tim10 B n=1 Tax=Bacillus rossius redtenbacheri TaxID=93214 RepID=UPI002FDDA098
MDYSALRNFKDFLQVYNIMSETCFLRCVSSFDSRDVSEEEARCVSLCTSKYINMNNKMMQVYMEVQPLILNKRMEEMNQLQAGAAASAPDTA